MTTSESRYPVVVYSQDELPIARLNSDCTWSVNWDRVMDQAYAAVTRTNGAIVAVCKAMIAGRDNFWTSAWEAEPMPYTGWQFEIRPIAGTPGVPVMALYSPDKMIAYVDNEAVWSIDWQSTAIIRSWPRSEDATALIGFCALLMGAKDNFHTNPFPELDYD